MLRGRDLIAMGFEPGPAFSRALKALEEEQLSGRVRTREEAEQFVRRVLESQTT